MATSSLPQMNIVGGPPGKTGFTMNALPTQENTFTKRASGACLCRRSMSDSSRSVKNRRTPFCGGASAMGFVASITVLPDRLAGPASAMTSSATAPLTASTTPSAQLAASAKVPTCAFGPAAVLQPWSLPGSRLARITS